MGTRIDIQVGQALLGQRVRDLAALNREQRVERERKTKESNAVQDALDAMAAKDAQRGQPQNNTIDWKLSPEQYQERLQAQGKKSGVPEYYTPPKVAVTPPQTGLDFAVGWLVKQSENTTQVVSGNGATGQPFTTTIQDINDASVAASPFTTTLTFASGPSPAWYTWTHRSGSLLMPFFASEVWYRFRPCSQVDLATAPEFASYGRDAGIAMPLARNMLYAKASNRDWYRKDFLLTASTTVDYNTATPYGDMIWTYEEVAGSISEDPDTLLATPSRVKAIKINVGTAVTVADEQETNINFDVFKCYNISTTAVREVSAPTALRTRIDEIYGTIPTPTDETGFSSTGLAPLPSLASRTVDGIDWTFAFAESIVSFTGYTRKNPNLSDGRTPGLRELYEDTPAACFGLGRIEPDNAEMRYGEEGLGDPLLYRILDGTSTLTEGDFYDTLETIAGCLTGLAPLPSKFLWVDVRPNQTYANAVFLDTAQELTFNTYASSVDNARVDGAWYDFGGDGLPSAPGKPSQLKLTLRPLADRIEPGEDFGGDINLLFTTPYGDKSYCRTKLLELGFTAADLAP